MITNEWKYCEDILPETEGLYLISLLEGRVVDAAWFNEEFVYICRVVHPYAWTNIPTPAPMRHKREPFGLHSKRKSIMQRILRK